MISQASSRSHVKCDNCSQTGHTKAKCWAKGGGKDSQYPKWFKGRKDSHTSNTINTATKTPIVWAYSSVSESDVCIEDSAEMVHVSSNQDCFTSYQKYDTFQDIKAFGKNTVKGIGEGDILADINF